MLSLSVIMRLCMGVLLVHALQEVDGFKKDLRAQSSTRGALRPLNAPAAQSLSCLQGGFANLALRMAVSTQKDSARMVRQPPVDPSIDKYAASDLALPPLKEAHLAPPVQEKPKLLGLTRQAALVIGLIIAIGAVGAQDRVVMSIAMMPIAKEFGFSDVDVGAISSIYSFGYTFALLPMGFLVQRFSTKVVLSIGVFLWSLLTILSPGATYVSQKAIILARLGVGAGEAVIVPAMNDLVSRFVPSTSKGTIMSLINTGFSLGTISALLLSPPLILKYGWPMPFFLYGGLGLLWLALWIPLGRDNPTTKKMETIETLAPVANDNDGRTVSFLPHSKPASAASEIDGGKEKRTPIPWRTLLSHKALWASTAAHATSNWALYVNYAWLPSFFSRACGLDITKSSLISIIPYVGGAIMSFVAGYTADTMLKRRGTDLTSVRKRFQGVASVGPAICCAALAYLAFQGTTGMSPVVAAVLLTAMQSLHAFNSGGYMCALQDISARYSSVLYGITAALASVVGAVGTYVAGYVLDLTGNWGTVFALNALVYLIGAAAFATAYSGKKIFPSSSPHADVHSTPM